MAEVKILIEGYATAHRLSGASCSTITLVRDRGVILVVDPGTLKNPRLLAAKLKKEGLTPADVNMVGITHSHLDHYRGIGLFSKAKALDYWGLWQADRLKPWRKSWPAQGERIAPHIRLIKTPGHSYDGITLLVETRKGTVAICGDVFWKKDFPRSDPYAQDKKKLKQSRKKVLQSADWVIPGHGKMFKVGK